jgi:hypothetical protein
MKYLIAEVCTGLLVAEEEISKALDLLCVKLRVKGAGSWFGKCLYCVHYAVSSTSTV